MIRIKKVMNILSWELLTIRIDSLLYDFRLLPMNVFNTYWVSAQEVGVTSRQPPELS